MIYLIGWWLIYSFPLCVALGARFKASAAENEIEALKSRIKELERR